MQIRPLIKTFLCEASKSADDKMKDFKINLTDLFLTMQMMILLRAIQILCDFV